MPTGMFVGDSWQTDIYEPLPSEAQPSPVSLLKTHQCKISISWQDEV